MKKLTRKITQFFQKMASTVTEAARTFYRADVFDVLETVMKGVLIVLFCSFTINTVKGIFTR